MLPPLPIPEEEFEWKYVRSGGSGGQNVNKVASKAVLVWNHFASPLLSDRAKRRLATLYRVTSSRMSVCGSARRSIAIRNATDRIASTSCRKSWSKPAPSRTRHQPLGRPAARSWAGSTPRTARLREGQSQRAAGGPRMTDYRLADPSQVPSPAVGSSTATRSGTTSAGCWPGPAPPIGCGRTARRTRRGKSSACCWSPASRSTSARRSPRRRCSPRKRSPTS